MNPVAAASPPHRVPRIPESTVSPAPTVACDLLGYLLEGSAASQPLGGAGVVQADMGDAPGPVDAEHRLLLFATCAAAGTSTRPSWSDGSSGAQWSGYAAGRRRKKPHT